jgi:two-component system, chemotaxis family, CheB/CheR fusion protein
MSAFANHPQYIIIIDSSFVNQRALSVLIDQTPKFSVSYVILNRHFQPIKPASDYERLRHVPVTDDIMVEAGNIYHVPFDKSFIIKDWKFYEDLRPSHNIGVHEKFIASIADELRSKIILLTTRANLAGIQEAVLNIKNSGGLIVLTSDPHAHRLNGDEVSEDAVPSIIKHHILDNLAPTDETEYHEQLLSIEGDAESAMNEIIQNIGNDLSINFSEYKVSTIYRRIRRRCAFYNINGIRQYVEFIKKNKDELNLLAKDFLISVTGFFRDTLPYAILEKQVVPEIINSATNYQIKIWVTGCATGEEAYSIAILFREQILKLPKKYDVRIFATDLDEAALKVAAKGIYPEGIAKQISPARLTEHFIKEEDHYRVKSELRQMLIFAQHDLIRNPPYCNVDLISCRNLLIYLNPSLQRKILTKLHFGLKLNGFLFLGASENLHSEFTGLTEVSKQSKIFQNLIPRRISNVDAFSQLTFDTKPFVPLAAKQTVDGTADIVNKALIQALASELGGAGLCITADNKVLRSFGDIEQFIVGKLFTIELTDLFSQQGMEIFNSASFKARTNRTKVLMRNFPIGNGKFADTTLQLLKGNHPDEDILLVLFQNVSKEHESVVYEHPVHVGEHMRALESEVVHLKNMLSVLVDQNNAWKENLQSFNEELLSANEEMQSTNEEWQSVNEELQTINQAYQAKIKELTDLNDDLNNYFRSNINGQLFVDGNLLLKKFSPATKKIINVRSIDIGRPITEITTNLGFDFLIDDIKAVNETGELIVREVKTDSASWFQVQIMPYIRKAGEVQDGAIISFYDISKLKEIERNLEERNQSLRRINADLDNFVYTASHDLIGPLSNLEGLIELMRVQLESNEKNNLAEISSKIQTALNRFKGTIRDLYDIGKIESEMLKGPDKIIFSVLVEDIKYSIHDQLEATGAAIVTDFSQAEINFSKKNLRSILYNLINNAIKFASPTRIPEIYINTYRVPGFVVIMVKDNGLGIPLNQLNAIFNMYHKINEMKSGQGLGLFLVKKITEASGGKVEVESTTDEGTVFKIYLPYDAHIL